MKGVIFIYGVVCYLVFVAAFAYAVGFVNNLVVPKSIDSGVTGPVSIAILINSLILGAFAVQHAIMARPAFKKWWTRFVPEPAERSTFVLVASLILALLFWQWRPIDRVIWHIDQEVVRGTLKCISIAGFGLVLYASFLIDHFDLFGLRQVYFHLRGIEYHHPPFRMPMLYRMLRNPLMLGFLIAFWAAPTMTAGHLLFSVLTTGYILVGIQLEERDLLNLLGEDYRQYRQRTPMLLPVPRKR